MKHIFDDLSSRFILSDYYQKNPNQAFWAVSKEHTVSLLLHLRDRLRYTHLILITCVDWLEENKLQLTYLLHNYNDQTDIGIKVYLPRENPVMESIHDLWKQARVYQQEMYEMFGIDFPGSPGVHEPMILEGWQGPPVMRRDFDTKKYSDEAYSHRPREMHQPEEHMKHELYPED